MNAGEEKSQKTVTNTFSWPVFDESDVNVVTEVARSGAWGNPDCSGLVEKFEKEFAAYCGSRFAITCANGSVALRLALMAAGVRPGDEVIVPPYTFIATASVVIECNCVPVFVDIDPDTYNIDPVRIEEAITPRTKAIIPVHFAGLACDMDRIMALASKHNLTVIEDAAHAHGGSYRGRKLGTIGHAGSFSFQSSKNLNSGEGGLVVTNDEQLYDRINSLRNVGRVKGGMWYEHHFLGCNYRITQFQAALLSTQLKRLDVQTATRDANGRYLTELLRDVPGVSPLVRHEEVSRHTYHLFMFRYDSSFFNGMPKRDFVGRLIEEGVPSSGGYPYPLYKQTVFQEKNFMCYAIPEEVDYTKVFCPVAERACSDEAIWIMQHAMLGTPQDMESFARAIRKIQEHC
ncbi:MAG TPA: DegT/DnrJ/EryC1/StrS family aminotransferase [Chryseolinea sp.]|nr:DegT/DnrJ/EryC1/StrS family aminotransferase [Chryseolinea sp.]